MDLDELGNRVLEMLAVYNTDPTHREIVPPDYFGRSGPMIYYSGFWNDSGDSTNVVGFYHYKGRLLAFVDEETEVNSLEQAEEILRAQLAKIPLKS